VESVDRTRRGYAGNVTDEAVDLNTKSNFFERTVTEYQSSGSLDW
jgi:ribonucleotide reductase beta subunit family protein with ferritin-like domain